MKHRRNRGIGGPEMMDRKSLKSATVDVPLAMALIYAERLRAWQIITPIPFPTLDQYDETLQLKPGLKA
jgi:hypothetical protein